MQVRDRVHRWAAAGLASVLLGVVLVTLLGVATSTPAGATSTVVASPSSLSFGAVTLGDYTELPFTLTNTGDTSITTGGIFTMGGDGNDFSTSPENDCTSVDASGAITMAPGDVCTIDVAFAPGALGTRSTVLILEDSGGFTSDFVNVSGVGSIGYYQVGAQGAVAHAGDANFFGDASHTPLNHPIVGMAVTGDDGGYWLVASDGGVFNYGPSAGFFGSAGALPLNKPVVGMAATGDAGGYWLVASDGGIFNYGDASFYGSTGSIHLNKPIVGMAPTPDGGGYWLVASDGGIFNYGDAGFYGSTGSPHVNKPIVGMAPTPDGGGYWLVASDGGVFSYGDAQFFGSTGAIRLSLPIVGMAAMPDGLGYWFSVADGGLFNYGTAPFFGSGVGVWLGQVVGMATDGAATLQAFADAPALRHSALTGVATTARDHYSAGG